MTYNENPELVKTVLEAELERQLRTADWSAKQIDNLDQDLEPLQEKRAELVLARETALTLAEGIKKVLGKSEDAFTGEVEEPAEEDPYDVAFAKTDTVEPSKTETFGRAPLMGEPGF